MKNKIIYIITVPFCLLFLGCTNTTESHVKKGEYKKTYTPIGLYAEVFVEPENEASSMITITSDSVDSLQVVNYFDGQELEKIHVTRQLSGWVFEFADDIGSQDSCSVSFIENTDSGITVKRFKLVPAE